MKKPGRKQKTGNPARNAQLGRAPDARTGGGRRWLDRESNAFFGMPYWSQKAVAFLALLVIGAVVWVWRALSA